MGPSTTAEGKPRRYWRRRSGGFVGRPRIPRSHISLIRRISPDHPEWGEDRIALELKAKLGGEHAASTIRRYMAIRKEGGSPASATWHTFLAGHTSELWTMDLTTQPLWNYSVRFVLVLMELRSRRVVRIAEKASAPVKNRAHTIETTIDLTGNEEGVIVAVGGMTGGFSMFIQDNRLYYDYNYLDGVHYILRSPPLPRGEADLRFTFIKTVEFGGVGELYVNGDLVDQVDMPRMHISTYSLAETFDVGRDTGTQVSDLYTDPFIFDGALDRVVFNVSDEVTDPALVPGVYR